MRPDIKTVVHDQHFMVDRTLLKRMVELAGVSSKDTVLDIGAGTGNLTEEIAQKAGHVIALEIDERLKKQLEKKTGTNTEVIFGNSLNLLRKLHFTKIVANPPYAILEPLLKQLAFLDVECAVMTLPERFVQKLLSGKTTLSLFCAAFFDVRVHAKAPRTAFLPEPHADSAIVEFRKRPASTESLVISMETKQVKNALAAALTRQGKTKKEAKRIVQKFEERELRDVMVKDLTAAQLTAVLRFIKECGQ